MRRDFTLALVVSLLLHGGLAWFGQFVGQPAARVAPDLGTKTTICVWPAPPPDPVPVEPAEEKHRDHATAADFRPPVAPDVPLPPKPESFAQPLEPCYPDNIRPETKFVGYPGDGSGSDPLPNIFNPGTLDQLPVATYQAKPVYPFGPRKDGGTGEVTVGFMVDASGRVQNAYAVRSTNREFESSAVQAVMHWKFKPGRKDGRAVNTRMQVSVVFHINEGSD